MSILIYGATGYTGNLILDEAKGKTLDITIAGRSEKKLKPLSEKYNYDYLCFDLSSQEVIETHLKNFSIILNCAGPFSQTAKPIIQACLKTRTHYLDITGEINIFEYIASLSKQAKDQKITFMPGVGFDVVPSDCLAAHMKHLLPDAHELHMAIASNGGFSRGTMKTAVESLGSGTLLRRDKKIISTKDIILKEFDFGKGPKPCIARSWGDVSTSYHSTDIPNITLYFQATHEMKKIAEISNWKRKIIGSKIGQYFVKKMIDRLPPGPSSEVRKKAKTTFVATAINKQGKVVQSRLKTQEGYSLTARTAVDSLLKVQEGKADYGFQTPSMAFGKDFILEFSTSKRIDL